MTTIQASIALLKAKVAVAKERTPRTLYVRRDVTPESAAAIVAHFKGQGLPTTMPADSLHLTLIYSKTAVDWYSIPSLWTDQDDMKVIPAGGPRTIEQFGKVDEPCIVMCVKNESLEWRHRQFVEAGCAYKFADFCLHMTITYNVPEGLDLASIAPFQGAIHLGPETWEEIDLDKGWSPNDVVEKGKGGKGGQRQYHREPAGTSKGGQFASADSWGGAHGGGWGKKPPAHTINKPGSVQHPQNDDKGLPVFVHKPTTPKDHARFLDPHAIATVVPGDPAPPPTIGGVPFKSWKGVDDWSKVPGTNEALEHGLPNLDAGHLRPAAGVIIQEKDGRVWLTRPTNSFGGYEHTFPKGGQEKGLTLQQTAVKETWEETGLQVKITGVFGDFKRTTSVGRYYLAERVGGDPRDMGWESQAVRLAPAKDLKNLLNTKADHDIVDAWDEEHSFGKAVPHSFLSPEGLAHLAAFMGIDPDTGIAKGFLADTALSSPFAQADTIARQEALLDRMWKASGGKGARGGHWATQERWPAGTPLGGQWKGHDAKGLIKPPSIGSKANPAYGKKADALYGLASTDGVGVAAAAFKASGIPEKAAAISQKAASGAKLNSNDKWWLQLHQYGSALTTEGGPQKTASEGAQVSKLSDYKKAGAKPGGSNPGALYTDASGAAVLIKGSNNPSKDGAHAHNEVLASKLMQAAGAGTVEMKVVDLQGQHGGGLGVASTMLQAGTIPLASVASAPVAIKAAQADFAIHAWLANYDAIGLSKDNTHIVGGKAVNIDPGGALMFRAQGSPKYADGKMPHTVIEWQSMRGPVPGVPTNAAAHSVYGSMTAADLKASAEKLAAITPAQIKAIVDAHAGPMDKAMLTEALIARRAFILKAAGVSDQEAKTPEQSHNVGAVQAKPATTPVPKPADQKPVNNGEPKPLGPDDFKAGYKSPAQFTLYAAMIDKAAAGGDLKTVNELAKTYGDLSDAHSSQYGFGTAGHLNYGKLADHAEAVAAHMNADPGYLGPKYATPAATASPAPGGVPQFNGAKLTGSSALKLAYIGEAEAISAKHAAGDLAGLKAEAETYAVAAKGTKGDLGNANQALADHAAALVAHLEAKASAPITKPQFGVEHGTLASSAAFYTGLADKISAAKTPAELMAATTDKKGNFPAWPTKADGSPKTAAAAKIAAYHDAVLAKVTGDQGAHALADLKAAPTAVKPTTERAKAAIVTGVASEPVQVAVPQKPLNIATPANPNKGLVAKADAIEATMQAWSSGKIDQATALAQLGVHQFGTNSQNAKVMKYQTDAIASVTSASGITTATAAHPATMPTAPAAPKAKAKDKTPKFNPDKISAPPSFIAWGSTGKPGPSGVAMVNEVNQAAAQAIYAAAKTGNPAAVTSLTAPLVNKTDGTLSGQSKGVLEHPSQHIKGYAQQALNEIDAQLNPPKVFRFGDGHPLKALDDAFPVTAVAGAAKKIGKYVDLGHAGTVSEAALALPPKATWANGKLSTSTYAKAAQEAIAKMPKTQKDAIKGYTGAGYAAMNKGMWEGNPSGAAKAAGEAIQTLGHDVAPGTILSRKVSLQHHETQALLSAVGKVLQEPAIQSTAVSPDVWSGNVHLKMVVGPGVKGLYVGPGSLPGGGALSNHSGEKELILPPNTRMLVRKVSLSKGGDEDGFGKGSTHIVEVLILPNGTGHDGKGKGKGKN